MTVQLIVLVLAMHGVNISVSYLFGHWFDLKASSTTYSIDSSYARREIQDSGCQTESSVY